MIYTFGCSMTKWYWPTWADWLSVYNQPVKNLAYTGYGNQTIYWNIVENIKTFTADDHIIIMWTENHRLNHWYDKEWIDNNDVLGFFSNEQGKLWFTKDRPFTGLYRVHPKFQPSFTHMIVDLLQTIFQTQLLLDKVGCKHTMAMVGNPWRNTSPVYSPKFETRWQNKKETDEYEISNAYSILDLAPINSLISEINWNKFAESPQDPLDPQSYSGLWEYTSSKKEFVIMQHGSDFHPNPLVQHDYLLEKILKQDPYKAKHRNLAKQIAEDAMIFNIPPFSSDDFIAASDKPLLDPRYKKLLESIG